MPNVRWLRAHVARSALVLGLVVHAAAALAQPAGLPADPRQGAAPAGDCPAGTSGAQVTVRAGTYVALGREILLRLMVDKSLESAVLIINRVDGAQLYDRRYWAPVRAAEHCGIRRVEYGVDAARNATLPPGGSVQPPDQRIRLLLLPAEEVDQPGLPQPMIFIRAVLERPGNAPMPLEFEEVVVKREISAN